MSQTNVVEPFQAMVTLCMLAYMPLGSRVCIRKFQLVPDPNTAYQGLMRWFYSDTRESMHCLFNAIRRFNLWEHLYCFPPGMAKLLRRTAVKGVEQLQQTYLQSETAAANRSDVYVLDMLAMYKKLISTGGRRPDPSVSSALEFLNLETGAENSAREKRYNENRTDGGEGEEEKETLVKTPSSAKKSNRKKKAGPAEYRASPDANQALAPEELPPQPSQSVDERDRTDAGWNKEEESNRIDQVFCRVASVVCPQEILLVSAFLQLLEHADLKPEERKQLLEALTLARRPMIGRTDAWITKNMVAI
mmetsp:Transcript_3843/g.5855  ORF Transcript_3843/g.5855 Transcript_3843/m.5855 type:complete len:305 (+) Transcript_3843:88-1002(+)